MSHSIFETTADGPAPNFWWPVLRDLGIAVVVVMAAGLIGGFLLLLSPVHAQQRSAHVRPNTGPVAASSAAGRTVLSQLEQQGAE